MWDPAESRTVLIGGKWWGDIGRWSTPGPSSLSIPWGLQSTPGSRFLQAQLHLCTESTLIITQRDFYSGSGSGCKNLTLEP